MLLSGFFSADVFRVPAWYASLFQYGDLRSQRSSTSSFRSRTWAMGTAFLVSPSAAEADSQQQYPELDFLAQVERPISKLYLMSPS